MWVDMRHTWHPNLNNVIIVTMNIAIPGIPTMVSVDVVVGFGAPKKLSDGRVSSLTPEIRDFKGKSAYSSIRFNTGVWFNLELFRKIRYDRKKMS